MVSRLFLDPIIQKIFRILLQVVLAKIFQTFLWSDFRCSAHERVALPLGWSIELPAERDCNKRSLWAHGNKLIFSCRAWDQVIWETFVRQMIRQKREGGRIEEKEEGKNLNSNGWENRISYMVYIICNACVMQTNTWSSVCIHIWNMIGLTCAVHHIQLINVNSESRFLSLLSLTLSFLFFVLVETAEKYCRSWRRKRRRRHKLENI